MNSDPLDNEYSLKGSHPCQENLLVTLVFASKLPSGPLSKCCWSERTRGTGEPNKQELLSFSPVVTGVHQLFNHRRSLSKQMGG